MIYFVSNVSIIYYHDTISTDFYNNIMNTPLNIFNNETQVQDIKLSNNDLFRDLYDDQVKRLFI